MLKFLYGSELKRFPELSQSMFRDRAAQFWNRLKWNVEIDINGEERDEYDALDPLYVIILDNSGRHQGSMRYLPTVGRTMINEHFLHLTDGVEIRDPFVWECTRFCIAPNAPTYSAPLLMAAGAKLMRESAVQRFVGIFDARMERIYRRIGAPPIVVGRKYIDRATIGVGLWEFSDLTYNMVLHKAGISQVEMELMFINGVPSSGLVTESWLRSA